MAKDSKKMNNSILLKIGMWLVAFAFAAGGFYLLVNYRLDAVEGDVKDVKIESALDMASLGDDIDYHDDRLYEQEKEIYGIKKDIGSLSEKVDRNFLEQKDFQTEQKKLSEQILKEIRK